MEHFTYNDVQQRIPCQSSNNPHPANNSNELFKENSIFSYLNNSKFDTIGNVLEKTENGVFEPWEKPYITNIISKSIITSHPSSLQYDLGKDIAQTELTQQASNVCPINQSNPSTNCVDQSLNYIKNDSLRNNQSYPFIYKDSLDGFFAMLQTNTPNSSNELTSTNIQSINMECSNPSYACLYDSNNHPIEINMNLQKNLPGFLPNEYSIPNYYVNAEEISNTFSHKSSNSAHLQSGAELLPRYNMPVPARKFSDPTMMSSSKNNYTDFSQPQNYLQSLYSDRYSPMDNRSTGRVISNNFSATDCAISITSHKNFYQTGSTGQKNRSAYPIYSDVLIHLDKLLNNNNMRPSSNLQANFMDFFLKNDSNIYNMDLCDFTRVAGAYNPNYYQPNLTIGNYIKNLTELFNYNLKNEPNKYLIEISTDIELLHYISNSTFYGNSIEAINIGKLIDLGLEKQDLILIIKKWLLQIFSNEYILLTNNAATSSSEKLDQTKLTSAQIKNKNNVLSPFVQLKNIIRLYETFIKNYEVIKTILKENSHKDDTALSKNSNDTSVDSNTNNKTILNPLFVQFTINSYHEYNSHKSVRSNHSAHRLVSNPRVPTIVNCLIYSEKYNDTKLFMMDSENGALPDLIIMNLPHLWSRDGKQFICHICENLYTRKYGLKIHLRTHNNNKPLSCDVCKKTFRDPSNLVKHSKIHSKYSLPCDSDNIGTVFESTSDVYTPREESTNFQSVTYRNYTPQNMDLSTTTTRKRSSSYI